MSSELLSVNNKRFIESRQIKKIKTLQSKLKMSDKEYRLLLSEYWVGSCKDLHYEEAQDLINRLEEKALKAGVWSRYSHRGKMKYEDLGERQGMASPKQLRMIEALWRDVSRTHNTELRQRALRKFIFRIVGVSDMRSIEKHQVQKIINAMDHMMRFKGAI